MRKLFAGFAALVLTAGVACAQAPFSDVPRDHWAYDAVNTLAQRGLVIGYPDGTFGGKRAMTRYEFAVVIARMLPQLEQYIQSEVAKATGTPTTPGTTELPTDLVRKGDLAGLATKADVHALRRLIDEFTPELRLLRTDVDTLKKDLADLTGRVSALETEVARVKVNGTLDVISRGTALKRSTWRDGLNVLGKDGYSMFPGDNVLEANQMQYLLALGITGKVTDKITANAVIDANNYFASRSVAEPFSAFPYGALGAGSRNADFGVYKAYIATPILGVDTEIGQVGIQFTPYTLKLADYDYYTDINQTDNGDYIATGVKGATKLGPVSLKAYAATHSNQTSATAFTIGSSANVTPRAANPLMQPSLYLFPRIPTTYNTWDQSAGVNAAFGRPDKLAIGATFVEAGIRTGGQNFIDVATGSPLFQNNRLVYFDGVGIVTETVRRARVYGANATWNLGALNVAGEWAKSELSSNPKWDKMDNVFPSNKNNAWDARATWKAKSFFLQGGYRQIDPFFGAPGSWGTIGSWTNPTNIKGPVVAGGLNLGKALTLTGGWDGYESVVAGVGTLIDDVLASSSDTKIDRITAGLKWNFNSKNTLGLKWENVNYKDIANPAISSLDNPKEDYFDIGWDTQFADNAKLRLLYQIIDYKNSFYTGGNDATGNVAVAQFTVSF